VSILPAERQGIPRLPAPDREAAILARLARLSQPYGTRMRIGNGVAVIELPTPAL
jgi:hypothetical protein